MRYREIYTDDFLDRFGHNKERLGNLELNVPDDWAIDLDAVLGILDIDIKEEYTVDSSGKLKRENGRDVIRISAFDTEDRKRVAIAQGIGHYILKQEGILYRKTE